MKNSSFQGAEPFWANACVGNNGDPGILYYAEGYASAANLLIDNIINSNGSHPVDIFIYPICFNMRHAVELYLKHLSLKLKSISLIKKIVFTDEIDLGSHDIGIIWEKLKSNSALVDVRYSEYLKTIDEFVSNIASIDPNGQVFRYPFDLDSKTKKHLSDISVINIYILRDHFKILTDNLNNFSIFSSNIEDEYHLGTHTKKLSRVQIFDIARDLPPKDEWVNQNFSEIKNNVKFKYNLSSNDLSRAICLITSNYETAKIINKNIIIDILNLIELNKFFKDWERYHLQKNERSQILKDLEFIDLDFIANIFALFEFGRFYHYSEFFSILRSTKIKELKNKSRDSISMDFIYLLNKTNLFICILKSLNILGQDLATKMLVSEYGELGPLDEYFKKSNSFRRR